jgi:hypothetical protein
MEMVPQSSQGGVWKAGEGGGRRTKTKWATECKTKTEANCLGLQTSRVEIECATQGTDGDARRRAWNGGAGTGRLCFGMGFFGAGNAEDGDQVNKNDAAQLE